MKVVIEFDGTKFGLQSDGGNLPTIALLEIAKASLIKKGMEEGGLAGLVRKVDFPIGR